VSREWKPGDVAMVDGHVAFVWDAGGGPRTFVYTDSDGDPCSVWVEGSNARPLVVIDVEDRKAVAALAEALVEAMCSQDPDWDRARAYEIRSHLRTALNATLTPPKPDEPTGLGAVVEDADGVRWVRNPDRDVLCKWRNSDRVWRQWSDLAAVRVLSDGVTP
jgi:hypothetical protein